MIQASAAQWLISKAVGAALALSPVVCRAAAPLVATATPPPAPLLTAD